MSTAETTARRGKLDGRVALVTGSSGDLGRAITRALAEAGASVVIHHLGDKDGAAEFAKALDADGATTMVVEADVSKEREVEALVRSIEANLGAIDVLVNNAGMMYERPLLETSLEQWERTLAVDLTGVFLCTRAVVRTMVERAGGSVINVASQLAFKGGRDVSAYCAAKAGVVGFTRAVARELGPVVRVNAVAPGPLETAMTAPFATPEWRAERTGGLVIGRLGTPEEVAPTVVFLASDDSALMHGQTLHVNGGGVMAG